jgi:hypothetical protein
MSSGGGDEEDSFGGNPLGHWGDLFDGFKSDPVGMLSEIGTFGFYDRKKGKLGAKGYLGRIGHQLVGELSGANAKKYAARQQQKAIDQEKAARKREQDLLWLDNYRKDVAASSAAQGMRASIDARAKAGQKLGSDSAADEDLLGV